MKKIIIVINNLDTGGVQKSLINLVNEIKDIYDITILSFYDRNGELKGFPSDIKVRTLNSAFKYLGMSQSDAAENLCTYIARAFWVILAKIFGRAFVVEIMSFFDKKISGYDTAISYLHEGSKKNLYGGCNQFVLNNIKAKQKIGWLHCDFKLCGANTPQSKAIYRKFDKIIACSQGCRKSFVECLPEFAEKCVAINNCNDYQKISEFTAQSVEYEQEFFNIVTVSRLSEEKGIERAIEAIRQCKENGYKIKYHIVGSGDMEAKLKSDVENSGLLSDVVFYGNQKNPYQYMVNADLFLLTSYHEAAPMVFDEAAFLGVPVLATTTTSTEDMLVNTGYGFECDNSTEGIVGKLLELLDNQEELNEVRRQLQLTEFTNRTAVEKIQELLA